MHPAERKIVYFSMEYGLDPRLYIYSGGLGVLAGDTLKSCADLKVPVVAVGLMYRDGYFKQSFDAHGWQMDERRFWKPKEVPGLKLLDTQVEVSFKDKSTAKVRIWQYDVIGQTGGVLPLLLLDTHFEQNQGRLKEITAELYRSDDLWWRMAQEVVLGWGGVLALQALGYSGIEKLHLNEGHAAFAIPAWLKQKGQDLKKLTPESFQEAAKCFAFTTHTPVPAGHDRFSGPLAESVLDPELFDFVSRFGRERGNEHFINLTHIALHAGYVNAVAKKHGAVSQAMFPWRPGVDAITNGIHAGTWVSAPLAEFFNRHLPGWKQDPERLRELLTRRLDSNLRRDLWLAHQQAKTVMIDQIKVRQPDCGFEPNVFTVGFARRAATYKRSDLILSDPDRLQRIALEHGAIQLVFGGKAHPRDDGGKQVLQRIIQKSKEWQRGPVRVVFIEDYDMDWGGWLTSGADIWLNNPVPPLEASGTSGMKAAINGVPSLSTADGWWLEGANADRCGWTFGQVPVTDQLPNEFRYQEDAANLYFYLMDIVRMYYESIQNPSAQVSSAWIDKMVDAIGLNGSYFNTHRMVKEYVGKAWQNVLVPS